MEIIEKINAEMQKAPSDRFLETIGHYLIDRCARAEDAARIGASGKSLAEAVEVVEAKARKMAHNSVAVLTNEDVFGEVDSFFGLSTDLQVQYQSCMGSGAPAAPAKKLSLSIEEFI